MTNSNSNVYRAALIAVHGPDITEQEAARSMEELAQLLRGLGIAPSHQLVQKRAVGGGIATYFGAGKLRELAALTGGSGEIHRGPPKTRPKPGELDPHAALVNLVVVDDDLSPGQLRHLQQATGAEVWDRTNVILRVFERRAQSKRARLEVELARQQYELPHIRDDENMGDREGGGGRASRGNSNVALTKQRVRDRIQQLRRELDALHVGDVTRRKQRAETFTAALIGYTNAGKSSLMRLLTGSEVLVEDKLFATLGTTTRQLSPPTSPAILLSDTVGFIKRLPHALISSFHSTLDEIHGASLLLIVVDAADSDLRGQLAVTRQMIADLGESVTPTWLVLNKIDMVSPEARAALLAEFPDATAISAHDAVDGRLLRERLISFFDAQLQTARLELSYDQQGLLAKFRRHIRVLDEDWGETVTATVAAKPAVLAQLRAGSERTVR